MLTLIELLLLVGTLLVVSFPLWDKRFAEDIVELKESELSDLLYRKDASFIALKDLEFDHKTGKIDDVDYDEMKARFEGEALDTIKRIDDYQHGSEAVGTVDQKVKTSAKPLIANKSKTDIGYCVSCGAKVKESHKFCYSCGASLPGTE
ncbi:hypothetical protein MNBD_NITROSPINAE04-1365 [hydrothermal vent metagenome]|uniref:Zinc-ribbon domain-containing protein n=1 Tax=hydrothermal vent metagenome TaxID=652676 RepID=A0A3B1BK44_9ZZZZ